MSQRFATLLKSRQNFCVVSINEFTDSRVAGLHLASLRKNITHPSQVYCQENCVDFESSYIWDNLFWLLPSIQRDM